MNSTFPKDYHTKLIIQCELKSDSVSKIKQITDFR